MTRETILKKAIEKVYKNGWMNGTIFDEMYIESIQEENGNGGGYFYFNSPMTDITELSYINIILSHSFCKAFFEPEPICEDCKAKLKLMKIGGDILKTWCCTKCCKSHRNPDYWWKYHGQQMFLAEDRLEYLEKFL